ncbi:MAG TPA: Na+/H+ antiporter NhaC family protein [Longimicrobiales bacterium]|nr:Na+/H+ antiporter NhaC family protein [Longimicrobiales bacterium]
MCGRAEAATLPASMDTEDRFPHPLALLTAGILLAAVLTWILPAGAYQRVEDAETGRTVVVAGTYEGVEAAPVGPFEALVAIPQGLINAAEVVVLVFLVGGAFVVIDQTGALRRGIDRLARRLQNHGTWVIPISCIVFATAGALQNMQEEIVALIPVLLILTRRFGFDPVTAVAMSIGAASLGSSFSPVNPFQVAIAQRLADVPLFSGAAFRMAAFLPALGFWIFATIRHARRTATAPDVATVDTSESSLDARTTLILALTVAAFGIFITGLIRWGWGFNEMSAVFFVLGVTAGLLGGLGINGTSAAYVQGFREMAFSALLIGFASAIYVVLESGRVVDTLVNGLVQPLAGLPAGLSAIGMVGLHALLHVPVPSVSGQAVLTMPILVPLSDLLGLSRQVTILAYQYGAGLTELITPTNGALMAVIAAAGVRYDRWLRFVLPLFLGLVAIGIIAILVAIAIGLQ